MEKDVGLSFDATIKASEARSKLKIPIVNKITIGGKICETVPEVDGFIKTIFKKIKKKWN
jgi:hypothetical protein